MKWLLINVSFNIFTIRVQQAIVVAHRINPVMISPNEVHGVRKYAIAESILKNESEFFREYQKNLWRGQS